MEGSGLRQALESVYASVSVGYMLGGTAYSRAIRGHVLIYSALISLILDPYLKLLIDEDLKCLTDLEDPSNGVDSEKRTK